MRRPGLFAAIAISAAALAGVEVFEPQARLIWNRTPSAPIGLYWRMDRQPSLNGWALLSSDSSAAAWIADHGFLASGWPIIKRVRAIAGDEICRTGDAVLINGAAVAHAVRRSGRRPELPSWSGCRKLGAQEFLLLNDHERSLDGRYFGVTSAAEIDGSLLLLWAAPSWLK